MKPKIFLDPDRRVYSARFKELKEPGKRAPEYTHGRIGGREYALQNGHNYKRAVC